MAELDPIMVPDIFFNLMPMAIVVTDHFTSGAYGQQTFPAFPEYRAGRHSRLSFRGLLRVHSRYGLPGCCSPCGLHLSPELQQVDLSSPLSG